MAKGNKERFRPGPDPRRHKFTTEQRQKGYRKARQKLAQTVDPVDAPAWLLWKVKSWYCGRIIQG